MVWSDSCLVYLQAKASVNDPKTPLFRFSSLFIIFIFTIPRNLLKSLIIHVFDDNIKINYFYKAIVNCRALWFHAWKKDINFDSLYFDIGIFDSFKCDASAETYGCIANCIALDFYKALLLLKLQH
jgi:hypothetical protein